MSAYGVTSVIERLERDPWDVSLRDRLRNELGATTERQFCASFRGDTEMGGMLWRVANQIVSRWDDGHQRWQRIQVAGALRTALIGEKAMPKPKRVKRKPMDRTQGVDLKMRAAGDDSLEHGSCAEGTEPASSPVAQSVSAGDQT